MVYKLDVTKKGAAISETYTKYFDSDILLQKYLEKLHQDKMDNACLLAGFDKYTHSKFYKKAYFNGVHGEKSIFKISEIVSEIVSKIEYKLSVKITTDDLY